MRLDSTAMSSTARSPRPNIALVGHGRWGRLVARDLDACGASVIAVSRSEESSRRALESPHVASCVRAVDELPEVRGVVVCTPTSAHAQAILDVVALGVPVFVEKPMTNDPVEARRLVDRLGDRLFIMDKWRYHPGVEELGRIAAESRFGAVRGLRTIRLGSSISHDDVDAVWVLAPHELSIGLEIFGRQLSPVSAVATEINGDLCQLSAHLGTTPWHALEISSIAPRHIRTIDLICEHGVVSLPDPYADHLEVTSIEDPAADPLAIPISTELPLLRELQTFLDYATGQGPAPRSTAADGLWNVETIAQLRELSGPERR